MPVDSCFAVGCLVIDDPLAGEGTLSGLSSYIDASRLRVMPFRWTGGPQVHGALQAALHALRQACPAATVIAARGLGCAAALALAAQLPVDRLALIEPRLTQTERREGAVSTCFERQLRRLCGFARRNLALCVSDVLVVEAPRARGTLALTRTGLGAHARVTRLEATDVREKVLCTKGEFDVKEAVSHFLWRGELPKYLAENSEMCIIYG